MEGKKISFGFMKTKKADKPLSVNNDEKKEFIECVEEKSIKVVGGEEVKKNEPLVIPMKPNTLTTVNRLQEIAMKVESSLEEPEIKEEIKVEEKPLTGNETLDQLAERELMQEAKNEVKTETFTMAITAPAKTVAEGQKESTLDDYEAVPIQEFGMAMLRGMGWTPGKDGTKYKQPELRPKGLGLGADKVVKKNKKKQDAKDSKGEELIIVKNAFVKITTGKYSGYYGKVVSLDEDNGRVMVDIAVKKETVSLSEFMMHAVTKSEFDKESKVINADSFDEYKKREQTQKSSRQEEKSSSSQRRDERRDDRDREEKERRDDRDREENERRDDRDREEREKRNDRDREGKEKRDDRDREEKERRDDRERERRDRQREIENEDRRQRDNESANGRSRNRQRRDSSSEDDRSSRKKKKDKKRYSSNDSLSSLSEDDRKQHKHSKHKSRRRKSRSRSNSRKRSPTPEGKRDIDKKRKGKKKKRDRDRSPNYKKHRK